MLNSFDLGREYSSLLYVFFVSAWVINKSICIKWSNTSVHWCQTWFKYLVLSFTGTQIKKANKQKRKLLIFLIKKAAISKQKFPSTAEHISEYLIFYHLFRARAFHSFSTWKQFIVSHWAASQVINWIRYWGIFQWSLGDFCSSFFCFQALSLHSNFQLWEKSLGKK